MSDIEDGPSNLDPRQSVLDHRDDPFAPRDGKTLTWRNVNMTLVGERMLLCTDTNRVQLC